MKLSLTLREDKDGPLIADFSTKANGVTATTGEHGFESLTFNVPLSAGESFYYYDRLANAWAELSNGATAIWEGPVEKVGPVADGLTVTSMGTWRQLGRDKYTALWSDTKTSEWRDMTADDTPFILAGRFSQDNNNRLYFAPRKNSAMNTTIQAGYTFAIPHNSSRNIVGLSFDYDFTISANTWFVQIATWADDFTGASVIYTDTSVSASKSGSVNIAFSGNERLTIRVWGASSFTYAGETDATFLKFSNIRVVTSTTNRVNTTTTTTISAGSQVVTPASMTGIYVGQRLFIDESQTTSESVVVTAVTSTTFTATFANAYSGTTTIHAHVVRPDEIVSDIVSQVSALDGVHLSSSTTLIENSDLDLLDEVYEDADPIQICTKLAGLGDADNNVWEVGVLEDQKLYYRPRASAGRHWYVDPQDLTVMRDIGVLANSVYANYQDENGRILRTAASEDTNSQSLYGATIKSFVSVNTTNEAMAKLYRDVALVDYATPAPQVGFVVKRLFDAAGALYPLYMARNGDMVTLRSLSPVLSTNIDRIRTFRIAGHSYMANDDALMMVPERPLPELERMIARLDEGVF